MSRVSVASVVMSIILRKGVSKAGAAQMSQTGSEYVKGGARGTERRGGELSDGQSENGHLEQAERKAGTAAPAGRPERESAAVTARTQTEWAVGQWEERTDVADDQT